MRGILVDSTYRHNLKERSRELLCQKTKVEKKLKSLKKIKKLFSVTKSFKAKSLTPVEEAEVLVTLEQMENDEAYNTEPRYAADTVKYPDNIIRFSQKHIEHLRKFPGTDPDQYISNLKLMTKTRT